LFFEGSTLVNSGETRRIVLSDGTTSDRVILEYSGALNTINYYLVSSGIDQAALSFVLNNSNSFTKIILKYKTNNFALWVNGFQVGVDASGVTPIGLNEISFLGVVGNYPFYGKTKEIGYYDTALTDEELEYLTSYRSLNELVTELNLNEL